MNNYNMDELLKTCEQEQLHLTGMIQSFASLIVIDYETFKITHTAKNLENFLNLDPKNILGLHLKKVLPKWLEFIDKSTFYINNSDFFYKTLKKEKLFLKISKAQNSIVIDIQKIKNDSFENKPLNYNTELIIAPSNEVEYNDYLNAFLKLIDKSINFNRILVYQLQEDWSGKVIAEKTSNDTIESYLGLMFPASDIPKIARDMYMLNPFRLIADSTSENIDLLTFSEEAPNLTYSDVRSVSPVHIEYLKNMGVVTSLSIPIIISKQLWGLLACHNFTFKRVDPLLKDFILNTTKQFSLGIQNYLAKEKINYIDLVEHKVNSLLKMLKNSKNYNIELEENKDSFLNLLNSDGLLIINNTQIYSIGFLPDNISIQNIDKYFLELNSNKIVSNSIQNDSILESSYLGPAGVLGIKLESQSSIFRCYWFRNEVTQKLIWAGNPEKSIVEKQGVLKLSPRRSFEKFVEEKNGYCKQFNSQEILTALKLANSFFKFIGEKA